MTTRDYRVPTISQELAGISELKKDIERVEQRIDHVEQNLGQRIDDLEQRMDQRIDGLDKRIDQVEHNLKDEIKDVRSGQRWLIGITITGIGILITMLAFALDILRLPY